MLPFPLPPKVPPTDVEMEVADPADYFRFRISASTPSVRVMGVRRQVIQLIPFLTKPEVPDRLFRLAKLSVNCYTYY